MSKSDKKQKNIVWILGAGFSKSLGAPLLADLFSMAQLHRVQALYRNQLTEDAVGVVQLYTAGAYGVPGAQPVQYQWAHAEEFLERLDLAASNEIERKHLVTFCQVAQKVRRPELGGTALKTLEQRLGERETFLEVHHAALRLLAAECCAFLDRIVPSYERWKPYDRWARHFGPVKSDTVITFNYDCIPDVLQRNIRSRSLWPLTPADAAKALKDGQPLANYDDGDNGTPVLKLHGSVNWNRRSDNTIHREGDTQALECPAENLALATPGPKKEAMVSDDKGLKILWQQAARAIREAHAVVMIGYQIPPTDAHTRGWLLKNLEQNDQRRRWSAEQNEGRLLTLRSAQAGEALAVYTVLGPNTNAPEPQRLKGLLERLGGIFVAQEPMWAEDFLAVFDRDRL